MIQNLLLYVTKLTREVKTFTLLLFFYKCYTLIKTVRKGFTEIYFFILSTVKQTGNLHKYWK